MDHDHAQLTSVGTALDELTRRVTELAETYAGSAEEQVAGELYEIERTLQQAARRLERIVRSR
jgi:hypothetical protein